MVTEKKIKDSFAKVKRDIDFLRYDSANRLRFLYKRTQEQAIRIRELERRLAQVERISVRQKIIG